MERVLQEDSTGCGLACVAMVAGIPYPEVRKLTVEYLGFEPDGPFYTALEDIRYLLDWYGYKVLRWTPFTTYESPSPISILELKRTGLHNHWVLLVKCGLDMYVLDPSMNVKTERRRDWQRLRPVNYANIIKA